MLGSILGDIIGSTYEFSNTRDYNFEMFPSGSNYTDDSVLTVAVADAVMRKQDYGKTIHTWAMKYPEPMGAYGTSFLRWMYAHEQQPYGSFGNGSAMRVSAIGWLFDTEADVIAEARKSAECTHNHPEGIKGAQATAIAVFFARKGKDKAFIQSYIEQAFDYSFHKTVDEIRQTYSFNETCQGTVPEALTCFFESHSFEDALRKGISIGGDSDTIGAIVGGIAEAFYGIPDELAEKALTFLPDDMLLVLSEFRKRTSHTSIDLSAETKALQKLFAELKKEFSELFLKKQNMLQHEEPLLTALYLEKVGRKKYEAYCLNVELAKLKQRLALLQAYINRNEKPDVPAVDAEIETAFAKYQKTIEAEAQRLAGATEFLKGKFLPPEEVQKVKEIYYIIVKRLHPDVNPNLSERDKKLFVRAQLAYEMMELSTLHEILMKLNLEKDDLSPISTPDLPELVARLQTNVNQLKNQIDGLNKKFPFIHQDHIFDENWVKAQNDEADSQIETLKNEIEKTRNYVTLLEEWQPE